ncbi:MAG: Uma2 family endonuclease [Gemmataceae bacterium]|nr:Uma2 family endonuclease [Gemmataceae bacterium]MCI0740208.1 Uma2 family endonuclease [Gemmataceae bacterium]
MERASHNQVKGITNSRLTLLTHAEDLGFYFADRMLLTNEDAGLSTEPDGMFVSHLAIAKRRVFLDEGDQTLEVHGSPDMTLEVVSDSSEEKDLEILRDLYWRAEISEYWLIDARPKTPVFDILRYTAARYVSVRKQDGWSRSRVFGKSFRLGARTTRAGITRYTLSIR